MKIALKIIIGAILSLSIGVACASPLLLTELNIIPYPNIPQGPKADFSVDTIYSKFILQPDSNNSDGGTLTSVNYQVVLNITNLSNISAKLGYITLAAAQNITVSTGALSEFSANSGGGLSGGGGGSEVEGLWLDGKWLNVTWIPGAYPMGLAQININSPINNVSFGQNGTSKLTKTIPDLPANASQTGYWMEGVPIDQSDFVDAKTNTITSHYAIFVNGSWVDVTGRIQVPYPQPDVIASDTLLQEMLIFHNENFGTYRNQTALNQAIVNSISNPGFYVGTVDKWAGQGGFNITWAPQQSRLIMLNGTVLVGVNSGLEALANGSIDLYASVSNYVNDQPVNGTYYDTHSTVFNVKQVPVQQTADGYLYNALLKDNQRFEIDQYGVEVFIEPGS